MAEWNGPDRIGSDRGGADRAGVDRAGVDRAGPDRSGPNPSGPDRSGPDRSGTAPQSQQIEALVRKLEVSGDPATQATARELVQALLDLHGAGLLRLMEIVDEAGEPGARLIERFTRDPAVNRLLLLHGLHPQDFETRVRQAVDAARGHLRSQGATVESVSVDPIGGVRVRVELGARHGCGASVPALTRAIEDAIYDAAPEVTAVVVDGLTDSAPPVAFVSLDTLRRPKVGATPLAGGD